MTNNHRGPVAVVDDDPAVRDSLRFLLEMLGYRVNTYGSATAFLDDRASRPACLIIDHHMPQMTGLELAAELRTQGTTAPILLISGALSSAVITRATEIGIEKVLSKPPIEDDLLNFVEACT